MVLVSCGILGLDWERTSLSMYMQACEAHGIANDPKGGAMEPADPEFRDFMKRQFAKS